MVIDPSRKFRHRPVVENRGASIVAAESCNASARFPDLLSVQKHRRAASIEKLQWRELIAGFRGTKAAVSRTLADDDGRSYPPLIVILNVIDKMAAHSGGRADQFVVITIQIAVCV